MTLRQYLGMLHLFAQQHPHDTAVIQGTAEVLRRLADALHYTAETGRPSEVLTFTSDGEGYALSVLRCGNEDALDSPYATREP